MSTSVIGVDLGGTKVAVAPLRGNELGESTIRPTERSGARELIDQLVAIVDSVRSPDLTAVGSAFPRWSTSTTGRVISSVNVPLADVPLRQVLSDRMGVPVYVDNDATLAALAEAHDEQLRLVAHNLICLTVGTGLGGGIVLGGRIYRGATGGAGELGHTLVGLDISARVPSPEHFPQHGSLESFAAGRALDHLAGDFASAHPDSSLGQLAAGGKPVLGEDVVRAATEGDADAARLVHLWGERVGIGIANAINTFDPEEVVIGGGGANAGDLLLEPARRVALGYVLPGVGRSTTIRLARHGVRAGVFGAALLPVHEEEDAK